MSILIKVKLFGNITKDGKSKTFELDLKRNKISEAFKLISIKLDDKNLSNGIKNNRHIVLVNGCCYRGEKDIDLKSNDLITIIYGIPSGG